MDAEDAEEGEIQEFRARQVELEEISIEDFAAKHTLGMLKEDRLVSRVPDGNSR